MAQVRVHQDVRSRKSIAVHCCTWSLTDEPLDEPPRELVRPEGTGPPGQRDDAGQRIGAERPDSVTKRD